MSSNNNLIALKECYDRIENSSSKLNNLFRKKSKELFAFFMDELEEAAKLNRLSLSRHKKILMNFFDEYYSSISPGITQQLLSRLQKDDKECSMILELPSDMISAKLDKFVNELLNKEVEKIADAVERSIKYLKQIFINARDVRGATELVANIGEIRKAIPKKELKRHIASLKSKHKALLSIIELISSTISDDDLKYFSKHRIKKPVVKKPAAKKTVMKKQVKKKSIVKKPVVKKPAAKKTVIKKQVTKKPVIKKLVAKKPAAKKIVMKKQVKKKTIVKKPVMKKPAAKENVMKKQVTKKPIVKKLVAKKPAAKKTVMKKQVTKRPIVKKPVVKKPAAKKTVMKKQVTKRPIVKIPVAKKPKKGTMPKSFIMDIYTKLSKIVYQNKRKVKRRQVKKGSK